MEPDAEGELDFKWLDVGVDASSGSTDALFCTLEPTPFPDSHEGFGDITRRQREAAGNAQAAGSSSELAPQQWDGWTWDGSAWTWDGWTWDEWQSREWRS